MRHAFHAVAFWLVAQLAAAQTHTAGQPLAVQIDGYAAKVNDRVITRGEVQEALAPLLPELYRAHQGPQLEEELRRAYVRTRDELVERALIMEAFKARGGMIPDQYVDDEIKRMVASRFKGDHALFEQLLAQQKKTRAEHMEDVRGQMAVGMMFNEEVARRARISPEQVRAEYEANRERYFIPEQVKYSVILLNKGATDEDRAVKRAEAGSIRQRLLDGADFGETARQVSEGSRAAEGGSFPWMQPKDARPELVETLQQLPAGETSPVIETETALYFVKVEARRQAAYRGFDEVRDDITAMLVAKERERLKQRWIARLKKNHYVVVYD